MNLVPRLAQYVQQQARIQCFIEKPDIYSALQNDCKLEIQNQKIEMAPDSRSVDLGLPWYYVQPQNSEASAHFLKPILKHIRFTELDNDFIDVANVSTFYCVMPFEFSILIFKIAIVLESAVCKRHVLPTPTRSIPTPPK